MAATAHSSPLATAQAAARPKPAGHNLRVYAEQIDIVFKQLPFSLAGTSIAALLLVAIMWGKAPSHILLGWIAVFFLHHGARLVLYSRYKQVQRRAAEVRRWAMLFCAGSAIAGSIWGSAGVLMFIPELPAYQALLFMILFGLASGALMVMPTHPPSFYLFIVPALAPVLVRTALEGDPLHLTMAALGLLFLVATLVTGRKLGQINVESLQRRYENLDLISELREQKEAAEQARESAEIANRAKSQFLAAASHDLRQPLHAMGLFVAALTERVRYPEVRAIVNNINASVEALESLFNALLDISKLDAGVLSPSRTSFPLQPLLDRLLTDYGAQAREKGLRFRVVKCKAMVYSDPTLLERILRNLVANAIRYTERGGIVVGCRRGRARLVIQVSDTGFGIPKDQQEKIFDEFYQLDNPERDRKKGLGLGLAIVKRLAQLLGYTVELTSVVGRGSSFSIKVPRSRVAPAQPDSLSAGARTHGEAVTGKQILVIDDERAVREGMAVLLTQWGYQVLTAGSVDDVLQTANSSRPDLIIADYRLREEMTGTQAIRRLQAEFKADIPAVLVTGDTAPDRVSESSASGFPLLHKPVPPAQLREVLEAQLRK
jgi:two-component system, sensor histidine kinase